VTRTGPSHVDPGAPDSIPWESRAVLGRGRAFFRTLVGSVRQPNHFYALRPRDASAWPAIAYGLVFELVVALASYAYERTLGAQQLGGLLDTLGPRLDEVRPGASTLLLHLHDASSVAALLFAPASYLLELLVTAGVTWIGLRLTKDLHTSFGVLVRLFAYASWVRLFGLIGVSGDLTLETLGWVLGFGFGAYTWVIVVQRSQGITSARAVLSSLVGGFVAICAGAVIVVPIVIAGVLWALANVNVPQLGP
jgi:hypothetical protein